MKVTTSGIDVAKSVFQVHGVDERGKAVLRRQVRRAQLLLFFSKLEPCLIGMEACASSHYWARKLTALGHTVRLMAPQFVKPYRKNDKNDGNDAEAICEAVQRPSMRFVPVKSPEQQAELAVHRIRRRLMGKRTALINQLRGLLAEYGLVLAQGANHVRSKLPALLESSSESLPPLAVELFRDLYEELVQLEQRLEAYDRRIERLYRANPVCQRLGQQEGIGALTATAFVATVAHAAQFKPYWGPYAVTKAALDALARTYAAETMNISRVRVMAVNPGPLRTKMRAAAMPGEDPMELKTAEPVAERILELCLPQFQETGQLFDYR